MLCFKHSSRERVLDYYFLLQCKTFSEIRNIYFNKFNSVTSDFKELNELSKLKILLGEGDRTDLTAQYISTCHNLRDSE